MANSISKQVKRYLTKHPEASNQELYKKFPSIRKNTLRHYKSRFADEIYNYSNGLSHTEKKRQAAAHDTLKSRVFKYISHHPDVKKEALYTAFPEESKKSLSALYTSYQKAQSNIQASAQAPIPIFNEPPIRNTKSEELEVRLSVLEKQVQMLLNQTSKSAQDHGKNSVIESIRELEKNLIGFITEKGAKNTNEPSSLDELQQFVSNKISSFITGLRIKKK